jgi:hypothetical protein
VVLEAEGRCQVFVLWEDVTGSADSGKMGLYGVMDGFKVL